MAHDKSKIFLQQIDENKGLQDPRKLAIDLMVEKNFWLIGSRWIYTFFISLFFILYNSMLRENIISIKNMGLILGLAVFGNIIFISALKRGLKYPKEKTDFALYSSMASLQLDFDLVILSLLVFFSKGFDSPVLVLFIFYIMVATFLIHHKKAFKNTITAMILVAVISLTNEGLFFSSEKLTAMAAFNVILLFTYLISAYLSRNMRENDIKLQNLLKKSQEMSVTDGLTNLYNQAYFFLLLRLQLEKSKLYGSSFSLIIFDIDYFKNYNDTNGHIKGSKMLQIIGDLMRETFRTYDLLARYGGDEFVVILPDSDKVGTFLAGDRLREMVEKEPFEGREQQPDGKITLSLGIANYPEHGDTIEKILGNADKALYYAKKNGRNRTVIYNEDMETE